MSIDVPTGWALACVEDVCVNLDRKRVPLNSEQRNSMKGDIPYWGANNIVDYVNDYIFDEPLVLMAEDGGNFDNASNRPICQLLDGKAWVNNHAHVMRVKEGTHREWVYYWFVNRDITPFINGGTRSKLNQSDLNELPLLLPPLPEQKKIAEVLGSVDAAIALSEAVITQTARVKQGLLSDLFHRGEWEPDKNKLMLPGHSLMQLDEIAERGSGHTPNKQIPGYWDGGIKWVSLRDTKKLDKIYISETTAQISEEGILNSSAVLHPAGIVVLSRDATVGRSAITTSPMAVSQHFIAWKCGELLDNHYLYYWLQYMKPIFEMIGVGSTIKTIGLPFFKKLSIPIPNIEEQRRTSAKLLDVDKAIQAEQANLAQLKRVKKGLMADLLTGKKRVTV